MSQFRVTTALEGKNAKHPDYPLLPGDILTKERDGTWLKHAPGLAVGGFSLTNEDVESLEPADEARWVISDWENFLG